MSSKKFGTRNSQALIQHVQARQNLWNPEDSNYKDKRVDAESWKEIAMEMQIPVQMVKSKWKNLRDMFNRELRRVGGLNSPKEYKGHWVHFKRLWFLIKPQDNLDTHFLDVSEQNDDDEDSKAYIIKVGPDYISNGEEISDRLLDDDEFDGDPGPIAKKLKPDEDDDYDIMFLKSLAPYMRSLSPVRKLQVRNQMQEIFIEYIRK